VVDRTPLASPAPDLEVSPTSAAGGSMSEETGVNNVLDACELRTIVHRTRLEMLGSASAGSPGRPNRLASGVWNASVRSDLGGRR